MNAIQRFLFWSLNTPEQRKILNKWKSEGRIPESYCRSLQEISPSVEDEFRRENSLGPLPNGWEQIRDELYHADGQK
jgi:hypothetical protein